MRISISFGIFVMDAMISRPMHCGILKSDGIEDHQNESQWPLGFV
jgi:hypothetical protein